MTRIGSGSARVIALGAMLGTIVLAVNFAAPLRAQNAGIDDLKGKIFDAKKIQQTFAAGLTHCSELDGTNFYFQPRDRVFKLEDYHRSLESLAQGGGFNPATRQPWNQQDADARWAEVQAEAAKDKANCALVASLPDLQKKLQELQQQAAAGHPDPSPDKPPSNN